MKKYITAALLALSLSVSAFAADVPLVWDANAEDEQIEKYNVYEVIAGAPTYIMSSIEPTATVKNVAPGKHTFFVTAVNMWGESEASNQVSSANVPKGPKNLRIFTVNVP